MPGGTDQGGGGDGLRLSKGHRVSQRATANSNKQPFLSIDRLEAGDSVPGVQSTQPALVQVRTVRACRSAVSQSGTEGLGTVQAASMRVDGADGLPEIRSPVVLVSTNAGSRRKRRRRGRRRALPLASTDVAIQQLGGEWRAECISSAQQADEELRQLFHWKLGTVVQPNWSDMQGYSAAMKSYWRQYDAIVQQNGVLYRKFILGGGQSDVLQFLAPKTMQKSILELAHASATGHLTMNKTEGRIQRQAYWYGRKSAATLFCRQCSVCATAAAAAHSDDNQRQDFVGVSAPVGQGQLALHRAGRDTGEPGRSGWFRGRCWQAGWCGLCCVQLVDDLPGRLQSARAESRPGRTCTRAGLLVVSG